MPQHPTPLPTYDAPPLDEVVMGAQFAPLKGFANAHLGLFWSEIRGSYPLTEDNAPLAHQKELSELKPSKDHAVIVGFPPARSWFLTQDKTELIQLQRDRFLRNWRRVDGTEAYPRYPDLAGKFRQEWQVFLGFVGRERLGEVRVDQCEMTYINQVEKGSGWDNLSDMSQVFTLFGPPAESGPLAEPEFVVWKGAYKLPGGRGRMHVEVAPAFRGRDFKMVYSMNLTARGEPAGPETERVFEWFDAAHEALVRAFDELTQPAMHTIWKKRS